MQSATADNAALLSVDGIYIYVWVGGRTVSRLAAISQSVVRGRLLQLSLVFSKCAVFCFCGASIRQESGVYITLDPGGGDIVAVWGAAAATTSVAHSSKLVIRRKKKKR